MASGLEQPYLIGASGSPIALQTHPLSPLSHTAPQDSCVGAITQSPQIPT